MNQWTNPLYGNFRTRTFNDIFPSVEVFLNGTTSYAGYLNNDIKPNMETQDEEGNWVPDIDKAKTLYCLLYARYGNSHIASSDENTFRYKIWSNIFMYGPTWCKRLEVQAKIRKLSDDDLVYGSKAIQNHSYNPSTAPSTATLEELDTINEQHTTQYKKNWLDAYTYLLGVLETDVTKYFIDTFSQFFLKIVEPELPLWYVTDDNDSESGGDL